VLDEKDIWHFIMAAWGNRLFGRLEMGSKIMIECTAAERRVRM